MPLTRKFNSCFIPQELSLTKLSAAFPELNDVRGAFTLVSAENIDDACSSFEELKNGGTIKGTFTCRGEEADPENGDQPEGTTKGSGGSSNSGSSSGSKDSAATSIQITGATGILGVVAVLFGLL